MRAFRLWMHLFRLEPGTVICWPLWSPRYTAPRPNGEALPHHASLSRASLTKSQTSENA